MGKTIVLITILYILSGLSIQAQNIIPKPKSYKTNGEVFKLTNDVKIFYTENLKETAAFLEESLSLPTGAAFTIKANVRGSMEKDSNGAVFIKRKK